MILQSILYPNDICECTQLYYKNATLRQKEDNIIIQRDSKICFFSYMNVLDIDFWKKYTTVSNINFILEVYGKGKITLICKKDKDDVVLAESSFFELCDQQFQQISFNVNLNEQKGLCYFEIEADSEVKIRNARFETSDSCQYCKDIHIALNICTYHRKMNVLRNIEQLRESRFFDEKDLLYQKMSVIIVDNGSEHDCINEPYIQLVHNKNTGGSGGFKRGLDEIRNNSAQSTHVVFMDDDVQFLSESLYRLYAVLFYIRKEYENESIAGRMFRMDERHIQYTAAEIWNKGEIKHIGLNADMTKEINILNVNRNDNAEYGGWWFCCYPMEFAKYNDPLPFFIHCDDVEYGLRHGGTPIVMNGIQVWHETYEYRQSAMMVYYDVRNRLIVNQLYNAMQDKIEIFNCWFNIISYYHANKMYLDERMAIVGMQDYLRGIKWCFNLDVEEKHSELKVYKKANKYFNAFLWRYTKRKLLRKENKNEV